jgi:ethanolamine utilization protein EutA
VTNLFPSGDFDRANRLRQAMEFAWRHEYLQLHDDVFEHLHMSSEASNEIARYIAGQETIELTTVGIDIGSSTSHLLFAKIILQREAQKLSARYVVVSREVMWRSPIRLTPFLPNGLIDANALGEFIATAYRSAGLERDDIDSGAVILTGEAIKRANAKAIDELFAGEAGKFVCATAGHQLEATLAAHGSGAVRLSRERNTPVLHVDIGGGTTKFALIDEGRILDVAAIAVGGRLIATDDAGAWTRLDDSAHLAAKDLGLQLNPTTAADPKLRHAISRRLAIIAVDAILGKATDALAQALWLTTPLKRTVTPTLVTFSGGVSEYLFGREEDEFGDIAKLLASEVREQLHDRLPVQAVDPGTGIRATVIGASQFTVQVSGKTIYLSDESVLPLRNVPVVHLRIPAKIDELELESAIEQGIARTDLVPSAMLAIAFEWTRDPDYHDLIAVGRAVMRVLAPGGRREHPLITLIDGDVGKTFGHILRDELHLTGELISIDGVQLQDLDFVDIGEMMTPPGVVPLVIKSLVFS